MARIKKCSPIAQIHSYVIQDLSKSYKEPVTQQVLLTFPVIIIEKSIGSLKDSTEIKKTVQNLTFSSTIFTSPAFSPKMEYNISNKDNFLGNTIAKTKLILLQREGAVKESRST